MAGNKKYRTYCQQMINYCAQQIRAAHWYWTATIVCGEKNLKTQSVNQITNLRDYEINYADQIIMDCTVWHDDFTGWISPNRNKLEVVLTRTEVHESPDFDLISPRRVARKYRAVLINQTEQDVSSSQSGTGQSPNPIDASKRQMQLSFQLIEIAAEKVSKSTFGGIIGESDTGDAIRYFMGEAARLSDIETEMAIKGVDLVTPDVKQKQAQVVIPHGTPTLAIPEAFQKQWGGVYNSGIGCYVAENNIFVYPLYDLSRFKKEKEKATIVVVPRSMIGNTKRTYVTNSGEVIILVAAEIELDDTTNAKQANAGNGQTVFDSAKMFNAPTTGESGKVVPDIASAMNTFITKKREDGLDFAPFANQQFTRNMAEVITANSKEMGRMMTGLWEWSYPEILKPMMPCRVVYFKGDFKHELYGVIMKHQTVINLDGSQGSKRHHSTTGLVMYVQREPTQQEKEEDKANEKFVDTKPLFTTLSKLFS